MTQWARVCSCSLLCDVNNDLYTELAFGSAATLKLLSLSFLIAGSVSTSLLASRFRNGLTYLLIVCLLSIVFDVDGGAIEGDCGSNLMEVVEDVAISLSSDDDADVIVAFFVFLSFLLALILAFRASIFVAIESTSSSLPFNITTSDSSNGV